MHATATTWTSPPAAVQPALFGGVGSASPIDWRLVRQVLEWKAPARFDDVIEIEVVTRASERPRSRSVFAVGVFQTVRCS